MPRPKFEPGNKLGGRPKMPPEIKKAFQERTILAIETLTSIMIDCGAKETARVAAASCLLDRAWGKPEQAVEVSGDQENPILMMTNAEKKAMMKDLLSRYAKE